ncbi:MAG: hypothetical protein JW882_10060, partial [Deltaproteobacteria bacterium]|nr:hypothetical protein [Deltaproteobacteria bacterium]
MKRYILILIFTLIPSVLFTQCGKEEKSFEKINDLNKAVIGVMTGTTGERLAYTKFPDANIKSYDD